MPKAATQSGTSEVETFLRSLDHPLKPALEAVRSIILGVSPEIAEGIKWNVPSFRLKEYFATLSIRKDSVQVVFHQGAKVTTASTTGLTLDDPGGLLEWLAKDRALVKFQDLAAVEAQRSVFEDIVRQWVACLP